PAPLPPRSEGVSREIKGVGGGRPAETQTNLPHTHTHTPPSHPLCPPLGPYRITPTTTHTSLSMQICLIRLTILTITAKVMYTKHVNVLSPFFYFVYSASL